MHGETVKLVTIALYIINRWIFITEVESVHCAVRAEPLYKEDNSRPLKVNVMCHDLIRDKIISFLALQQLFFFSPFIIQSGGDTG